MTSTPTFRHTSHGQRDLLAAIGRLEAECDTEDDAYGLLPTARLPAIATFAPEITIHIATVSKVLSPALRVAYLVAPDARCAARLTAAPADSRDAHTRPSVRTRAAARTATRSFPKAPPTPPAQTPPAGTPAALARCA